MLPASASLLLLSCAAAPLTAPAELSTRGAGTASARPPKPDPVIAPTSKTTESYELWVGAPPSVPVGQSGSATVRVTARAPYKITPDYPARLTIRGGSQQLQLASSDASIETHRLTFNPALSFARPGTYVVRGQISFSLCDKHSCLLRREPVQWTARVRPTAGPQAN